MAKYMFLVVLMETLRVGTIMLPLKCMILQLTVGQQKQTMPESRSHLTGCVLNNKIFALGGTQLNKNMSYATMFSYNPKTDTWESEPSMITAREAFKAVVVNGKIYAIGGTEYPMAWLLFQIPKYMIRSQKCSCPIPKCDCLPIRIV